MKYDDLHGFSSDRPITEANEDLLGRANFANDLADAIDGWHGNDSLVVALHGEWGSGKSSIKNMALAKLSQKSNKKSNVIEFSPWEWAAQEKITSSFFQEISKSIGRTDKSESGKKLAQTLQRYGQYLSTGEVAVTSISGALPAIFLLVAALGISNNYIDDTFIKTVSTTGLIVLSVAAACFKWGERLLQSLSGSLKSSVMKNEHNLSDIRQELTTLLKKRNVPLIIVMDDLDRLTSDQLRMVFQLIKANTEFPNVVFLLLYQRDLVEDKMTEGNQQGRDYLEKIIQVPFSIPKAETSDIHKILFDKLNKIIFTDESASKMFNSTRWGNIFYSSLSSYFDNLRNVYRFSSTLSFYFTLFKGKKAFEVNPVDLIAIECLRVFEPEVYKEIALSKNIFTRNGRSRYERDDGSKAEFINNIIEKSSPEKKEVVKKIITQLFPTISWVWDLSMQSDQFIPIWLKEMRICHPSNFDKYFQFTIPNGELSHSELQEMLHLTADSDAFKTYIFSLKERDIVKNALSQFESYTDEIPLKNKHSYIKGILNIGDHLDNETVGFVSFSENMHALRLALWYLKRIVLLEERGNVLLKCFEASNGFSIVGQLLQSEEECREKKDDVPLLEDKALIIIKDKYIEKLNNISINNPSVLLKNRYLAHILYSWMRWGDQDNLKGWLKTQLNTTRDYIRFLVVFTTKSSSHASGDYIVNTNPIIQLEEIENFIDVELIQQKLNKIDALKLNNKEQEALNAFQNALERRAQSIDDSRIRN